MQLNLSRGNQTMIDSTLTQIHTSTKAASIFDYSLLNYLRIVFYVFIIIKLVQIVFMRRRKLKISERIQRKFLFAHGIQMIKNFSAEEHQLMNLTLQNTLKNAVQPLTNIMKKQPSKVRKTVSFLVQSNKYYDPPQARKSQASSQKTIDFQIEQKKFEEQSAPLIQNQQKQTQTQFVQCKQTS